MRILPEGLEEWMLPGGNAMQIIAGFMLAIALVAFAWRMVDLATWKSADGVVTAAELTQRHDEDGDLLCSADYDVRYVVNGASHVLHVISSGSSNNCAAWKQRVAGLPGRKMKLLYNPGNPDSAVENDGKNAPFFIVSVILSGLALGFGLAGTILKWQGKRMLQRGFVVP